MNAGVDLQAKFPFQWTQDKIKYLGIFLTPTGAPLFGKNYLPLLTKIAADLLIWTRKPLSWFSRTKVIKMIVLPKILYLFQALPIAVPPSFFKT